MQTDPRPLCHVLLKSIGAECRGHRPRASEPYRHRVESASPPVAISWDTGPAAEGKGPKPRGAVRRQTCGCCRLPTGFRIRPHPESVPTVLYLRHRPPQTPVQGSGHRSRGQRSKTLEPRPPLVYQARRRGGLTVTAVTSLSRPPTPRSAALPLGRRPPNHRPRGWPTGRAKPDRPPPHGALPLQKKRQPYLPKSERAGGRPTGNKPPPTSASRATEKEGGRQPPDQG